MQRTPPDEGGKASSARSGSRVRSPPPKSGASSSARRLEELAEENVEYQGDDVRADIRTDVQEGNGSEVTRTIPIHTTGLVSHVVPVPPLCGS